MKTRPEIMEMDDDAYLLPGEVAELFRVDPKTITRWAAAGKIPHIRTMGKHTRYRLGTMKELLTSNTVA
jgi:excisionase family DNA binding protein